MNLEKYTNKAKKLYNKPTLLPPAAITTSLSPGASAGRALLDQADGCGAGNRRQDRRASGHLAQWKLKGTLDSLPRVAYPEYPDRLEQDALKVFNRAEKTGRQMRDEYTSTEHILLGLTEDKDTGSTLDRHRHQPGSDFGRR